MFQFFIDESNKNDNLIYVTGEDLHHMKDVVRISPKEKVRVSVGKKSFIAELSNYEDDRAVLNILEEVPSSELSLNVTLYQGMPKGEKFEFIIEKATELGATRIVPVMMENSVVKLKEDKVKGKIERWQKIIEAAAKQSKRSVIPLISSPMPYKEALEDAKSCDLVLVPYENERGVSFTKELLSDVRNKKSVAVFIGPEGGFSDKEVALTKEYGYNLVSLGNRILRTETAAICALSLIMIEAD
ncbi:MAG: 16S rRNA (uracil(1498)-N(3))-methyltransferase [Lachnospiraceae bacterium]|nr:16S rRNA (uracil(1498)-N(3))-methyltransferase [Lachnospiraceae bacterium]